MVEKPADELVFVLVSKDLADQLSFIVSRITLCVDVSPVLDDKEVEEGYG